MSKPKKYIERVILYDQMGFIPGIWEWVNRHKGINVICHLSRMKEKPQNISIDARHDFDRIAHLFTIKALSELEIEGNLLWQRPYMKNPQLTHLQWWRTKLFHENWEQCPLLQLQVDIMLEVPAKANGQEVKLFLFSDNMILYLDKP